MNLKWTVILCGLFWIYLEWFKTYTFCTSGQRLHCDPEVSVYTCSGHGLPQSGGHTRTWSTGILWLGMVGRGVAQREPHQSLSCVACTWTDLHHFKTCLFMSWSKGQQGDWLCMMSEQMTCVYKSTVPRGLWVCIRCLLEHHSWHRACSSVAVGALSSCMPHIALGWTVLLHRRHPQPFKTQKQTLKTAQTELRLCVSSSVAMINSAPAERYWVTHSQVKTL